MIQPAYYQVRKRESLIAFASADTYRSNESVYTGLPGLSVNINHEAVAATTLESVLARSWAKFETGPALNEILFRKYDGNFGDFETQNINSTFSYLREAIPGHYVLPDWTRQTLAGSDIFEYISLLPVSLEEKATLLYACTYAQANPSVTVLYLNPKSVALLESTWWRKLTDQFENLRLLSPNSLVLTPVLG